MEVNKEVLKGHIDTLILSLLHNRDMYGYELAKIVREKSDDQFELKEGTLYLSLKRLEKNKWISSYWGDEQGPGGRRKYYKLTSMGEEGFEEKRLEWEFVRDVIDSFLDGGEKKMKQIEVFVDEVYQGVGGNEKEIKDLKTEMKNHLLEAVYELKKEGKSEQEAIEIAIDRFGGEKEIRSVVGQLFQAQKIFAKRVLYIAFTFLLLGIISFFSLGLFEYQHYQNVEKVGNEILGSLGTLTTISNDTKEIMVTSVEDNTLIYGIKVNSDNSNSDFEFSEDRQETNPFMKHFNTGFSNKDWSVEMEISNFDDLTYGSLFIGLVVYWVLFTIWATINAYHHRGLNTGWIIAFALLNVVGYLFFRVGKGIRNETN